MNDLIRPALYQAHHEIVAVRQNSSRGGTEFDVVGPVCESADVLGYSRKLSASAGDLIAVLSAGAYGFVMSSNYNTRATFRRSDGRRIWVMSSVRERETVDNLLSGEHLLP
jgi:diaminopimelate decarboxylase